MNSSTRSGLVATALGLAFVALAALSLSAANDKDLPSSRGQVGAMPVVRAHSIAGMTVKNPAGQDLGKVEDIVIDMGTGKVRYAAISFGGFLGVGDKLFAVPFHALKVKHNAGDKTTHFVLNVDKKTLEKAPGFDSKNWPDFGNPRYSDDNDRYYGEPTKFVQ
jgi:sporulation protein YlmC with PRC-barrel domain